MKLLSDKEFKEIKETIEMYKDNYNHALEDYYNCDKFAKNCHNKYIEKLDENNCLQTKINKAIEYIESYNLPKDLKGLSEAPISVNELKVLLRILKGEE